MTTPVFLLLLPVIGGIAGTLQAHFMGVMDTKLGTVESMFITYGGGGMLIALHPASLLTTYRRIDILILIVYRRWSTEVRVPTSRHSAGSHLGAQAVR